jgi:hypothetical protein
VCGGEDGAIIAVPWRIHNARQTDAFAAAHRRRPGIARGWQAHSLLGTGSASKRRGLRRLWETKYEDRVEQWCERLGLAHRPEVCKQLGMPGRCGIGGSVEAGKLAEDGAPREGGRMLLHSVASASCDLPSPASPSITTACPAPNVSSCSRTEGTSPGEVRTATDRVRSLCITKPDPRHVLRRSWVFIEADHVEHAAVGGVVSITSGPLSVWAALATGACAAPVVALQRCNERA